MSINIKSNHRPSLIDIAENTKLWEKALNKKEHYEAEKHLINEESEINSVIEDTFDKIYKLLLKKIWENFSCLDDKYKFLTSLTYWDMEHSYWWNRLLLDSKMMGLIKEWDDFSFASYDLNWMWISNYLSKNLWNLRILELSYISHSAVQYLKDLWYEKSYFARTWWDEFKMITNAPDFILKEALEHWRGQELWNLKEVLKPEIYNELLVHIRNTKWWKNEEEWLSKISWFTAWINSYNYKWVKVKNLKEEVKKISTWTDEAMEHYKSWRLEKEYKEWIINFVNSLDLENEKKEEVLKVIRRLHIKRNFQEKEKNKYSYKNIYLWDKNLKLWNKKITHFKKIQKEKIKYTDKEDLTQESIQIKSLGLNKKTEEKIIEKIEWYLWWENKIIVWNYTWKFKTPEENARDISDFKESNDLSEEQNENFSKLWKKLEEEISEQFNKLTKKRNKIIREFKLSEKEIENLDYLLWKAKFRREEINKIKNILDIPEEEIQELKVEYIKALLMRWHYTWSYQSQISEIIKNNSETWFLHKNKIVINSPSFKSINETSWHTNWDYFLMAYVKHLKDEMLAKFKEIWIDKKEFSRNIVIISKWPNTEIFINEDILNKNPKILYEFKEKIKKSNFLEEINEKIWKDKDWNDFLDKRINFIKENQKDKIIDIKKELLLLDMWKNLQEYNEEIKNNYPHFTIWDIEKIIEEKNKYSSVLEEYENFISKKYSEKEDFEIEEIVDEKIKGIQKNAIKKLKEEMMKFEILK